MVAIGPIPASMRVRENFGLMDFPEPKVQPPHIVPYSKFVPPPEMPENVKVEAVKGHKCYYGFYFPDAAIHAYDKAHNIDRPSDQNPESWTRARKRSLMFDTSYDLGIRCWAHFALSSLSETSTQNVDHHDIVWFAVLSWSGHFVEQCLPDHKIKELMEAMEVEGEPQWILE